MNFKKNPVDFGWKHNDFVFTDLHWIPRK